MQTYLCVLCIRNILVWITSRYLYIRTTPMGVVIRGVILITVKMAPQRQKIKLQWRWYQRCQNAIQGFGVAYLTTLEREWRGCKIAVGVYCTSQRLYFISYLTSLRNIELLKWHPILAPTIGAKTLLRGAKTLFRVVK